MNKILLALISYVIVLIYYFIIDGTMIMSYMGKTFGSMIQKIQGGKPMQTRLIPAILSFVVLAFGITYFILNMVRDTHIIQDSAKYAIPFGFVIYATYDLTNLATLKDYTTKTALIDIIWGSILAFLVTVLTKYTLRLFKRKDN